jgi:hypothetical protein
MDWIASIMKMKWTDISCQGRCHENKHICAHQSLEGICDLSGLDWYTWLRLWWVEPWWLGETDIQYCIIKIPQSHQLRTMPINCETPSQEIATNSKIFTHRRTRPVIESHMCLPASISKTHLRVLFFGESRRSPGPKFVILPAERKSKRLGAK